MFDVVLFIQILTIYLVLIVIIAPLWAKIDRNLLNAQLLESGRAAKETLARMTDMMSMTNSFIFYIKEGRNVIFAQRFFDITHLHNRPIPVSVIRHCMSDDDKAKFDAVIKNTNPEGASITCTINIPSAGTSHAIQLTVNNVKNEDGENTCIGLFMLLDDVRKAEVQRREAEKMEEDSNIKSSFLASMGHEIRTPLNAIVGFTQIISTQYEYLTDEDRKGYFDIIKQNNDQLLSLLDSVTLSSDIASDSLKLVLSKKRVSDLMEEIYLSHTVIVPKNLQLLYKRGSEDDFVMINRGSMLQVMSNLMNNAIKFTESGSITLGWESDDDHIIFYVQDTGIGIKEEDYEKIFSKFGKVSSTSKGAGFGLPLCKRLVEKMNGKIQVKSRFGEGSRFEVIFGKVK